MLRLIPSFGDAVVVSWGIVWQEAGALYFEPGTHRQRQWYHPATAMRRRRQSPASPDLYRGVVESVVFLGLSPFSLQPNM